MTTAEKIDLYKHHKEEYAAPKTPRFVDVAPAQYLAIDGTGTPGNLDFESAVVALYCLAYTLKFASKGEGRDFGVCKLEGRYTTDAGCFQGAPPPEDMQWTLMIRMPDFIGTDDLAAARSTLAEKGKEGEFGRVRLETIEEGRCVQMLHVGAYADEGVTLAAMMAHADDAGLAPHGPHHEIYLSDPRRVPEERLRTILRQPIRD